MNTCPICNQTFTPKRKEQQFCSIACRQSNNATGRRGQLTGRQLRSYKQRMTKDGYFRMYAAKHPYANGRKEIHVHVMVMEMHIGRQISVLECVHHKNGIKTDNRLENLELMLHAAHSKDHNLTLSKARDRNARGQYA